MPLDDDRQLAMRALRPRQAAHDYDTLTRSGRAEVDRIVAAFDTIRESSRRATKQHRMDDSCWCNPLPLGGNAWAHR
jgi:hypothetical protein